MLENSRKRSRKSKLEVREDVELEEATFLYMEAFDAKVKEEPMMDITPTTLLTKINQAQDPFNDVATPTVEHKPLMEFSVKIEVEECDETELKDAETINDQDSTINQNKSQIKDVKDNCPSTSLANNVKPTVTNIKPVKNENNQKEVSKKEFKEYITNRPTILKVTDRLLKSVEIADQFLAIGVRNYAGRVLDDVVKDKKDMLLQNALEDWQTWHEEHSAVRDTPLIYKCYICGEAWWYLHEFSEHLDNHLDLNQFEVSLESDKDECSLICFQLDIVYQDIELPKSHCDRCGKPAQAHAFVDNDPYICLGCKLTFSTCSQLKLHENSCPQFKKEFCPDDSDVYECSVCNFVCNGEASLNDHMIRRHSVRSDMVTTWDMKLCPICSRTCSLISLHICIKKTNNYGCNYCGRSFQKKVYKEIHMANYSGAIECRICKKTLMAKCMEYSHMLQHTDKFALMYKCIQCIEGRYYPDEYSIMSHTKNVHLRPFEKKFKYLEMVILPKQCMEKSSKALQIGNSAKPITESQPSKDKNESQHGIPKDVANSNVFVPSSKYRTTQKQLEIPIDVVIKQEPVDGVVETVCVSELSGIKTESVESSGKIQISDITSLQEFMKFKTEPVEEMVAEDLIIIEEKVDPIELYSSDNSENDFRLKYTGSKRKKLKRIACVCGYVDIHSRIKAHKLACTVTLAKRAARKTYYAGKEKDDGDKLEAGDESGDNDASERNTDDEWQEGDKSKSGLRYTCVCKKMFVGTLAAFKRHKKACTVMNKIRQQRKESKLPTTFTCTKCHNTFNTMLRYCKHLSRVHYFQNYMCPQCLYTCDSLGKLTGHVTMHVNRNFLKMRMISESQEWTKCNKCKICKKPIERIDYFKHWESHLELNSGDPSQAQDSSTEEDTLVIDMESPIQGYNEGQSLFSPEVMQRALDWLQSSNGWSAVDEKTCVFCARRFTRKNDSKRHVIEHLLQDAFAQRAPNSGLRCQICAAGFPKGDSFKHHMREHAGLPVYQCNLCGKSFSDSSNFCKHKKVHGLSHITCSVCSKKFHNANHLARHMEMHEKTKPIICDICEKISFTQSAHRRHYRSTHEKHKARSLCPICRIGFTRLKDKWDHMWVVHKERSFNADCPICSQSFRRFADVKSHVKKMHDKNARLSADRGMVVFS